MYGLLIHHFIIVILYYMILFSFIWICRWIFYVVMEWVSTARYRYFKVSITQKAVDTRNQYQSIGTLVSFGCFNGSTTKNFFPHVYKQLHMQSQAFLCKIQPLGLCCGVPPQLCSVNDCTEIQYSIRPQRWRGMSGERPICNYFLLNQHKAAGSRCVALVWMETTCGAGWRKALTQQAPKECAALCPFFFFYGGRKLTS